MYVSSYCGCVRHIGTTSLLSLTPVRRIKYQKNHEIWQYLTKSFTKWSSLLGLYVWVTVHCWGWQGRNSRQVPQPETMEEHCLLAHSLARSLTHTQALAHKLSHIFQNYLPRDGPAHSGLGLLHPLMKTTLHRHIQRSVWSGQFLGWASSSMTLGCVRLTINTNLRKRMNPQYLITYKKLTP